MGVVRFPDPRYLLEYREPIDGSWRPMVRCGRTLIYRNPALAGVVARTYGPGVRVRDTEAPESQEPEEWQAWT
jgi:hypothetical protein